jgi:hypothetical protein
MTSLKQAPHRDFRGRPPARHPGLDEKRGLETELPGPAWMQALGHRPGRRKRHLTGRARSGDPECVAGSLVQTKQPGCRCSRPGVPFPPGLEALLRPTSDALARPTLAATS